MERIDPILRAEISSRPTSTLLKDETVETIRQYNEIPKEIPEIDIELPKSFNGKEIWKDYLTPSIDQGKCGSCWAFASVSCLADKFNIQTEGKMHIELSPILMLLCYIDNFKENNFYKNDQPEIIYEKNIRSLKKWSCFGNTLMNAWKFLNVIGASTMKCLPYEKTFSKFKGVETLPLCFSITGPDMDMCQGYTYDKETGIESGNPIRFYRCKKYWSVPGHITTGGTEDNIKYVIYKWGPVTAGFVIYPDFYTFDPKTTIYQWNGEGNKISGHAVEIVGWGEENGIKYWIIKNFWGPEWGDDGYFRMIRGINNCDLEDNVIDGAPDFFYPLGIFDPKEKEFSIKISESDRNVIDTDLTVRGGGIDPETGYTRRVILTKPWLNKKSSEYLHLPNFNQWFAGKIKPKNNMMNIIYIILIIIIIIIILFLYKKY